MKDVIVYHNPDAMGYAASEVTDPVIVTNKRVSSEAIGDRIWLITGEGQPRRYYLCGYFNATEVEPAEDEGFRTRVRGEHTHFTRKMIAISDEEWFPDLRRSQGNFAFGYQVIKEPRFVQGLEEAIRRSSANSVTINGAPCLSSRELRLRTRDWRRADQVRVVAIRTFRTCTCKSYSKSETSGIREHASLRSSVISRATIIPRTRWFSSA